MFLTNLPRSEAHKKCTYYLRWAQKSLRGSAQQNDHLCAPELTPNHFLEAPREADSDVVHNPCLLNKLKKWWPVSLDFNLELISLLIVVCLQTSLSQSSLTLLAKILWL